MLHHFNILFFIYKSKVNFKGYAPIFCRITLDGVRKQTVINTLLHHPNLFNAYVSLEASLWWKNKKPVEEAKAILPVQNYRVYQAERAAV